MEGEGPNICIKDVTRVIEEQVSTWRVALGLDLSRGIYEAYIAGPLSWIMIVN